MPLTLITYLSPSLPPDLFEVVATAIAKKTKQEVRVVFEVRHSGPMVGDDDPFTAGEADFGFVCAPSFRWLSSRSVVELMPLMVPLDPRCGGRPVYFSDIVVRRDSPAQGVRRGGGVSD